MNQTLPSGAAGAPALLWLLFSLVTVLCWGLYGVFLHNGQAQMGDPLLGRYKAFLWVGIAYFITAVLAPLFVLGWKGGLGGFPARGIAWSILAGVAGAAGAFSVLLAFGAKGTPAAVMAIVFAGAPMVNALYSLLQHPPAGGWLKLPWPFLLGILLAAAGGCLVSLYKPPPAASTQSGAAPPPALTSLENGQPLAVSKP